MSIKEGQIIFRVSLGDYCEVLKNYGDGTYLVRVFEMDDDWNECNESIELLTKVDLKR